MGYLLRSSALQHRVPPTPSQAVTMVVTSKLLAAHTSGYPLDVSSRFWTNYYRSLKGLPPMESYSDFRCSHRRLQPPKSGHGGALEPWWHHVPALRPASLPDDFLPAYTKFDDACRPSYLSPVRRRYLWSKHPIRPRCLV